MRPRVFVYAYAFYLIGRSRCSVPEHQLQKLIGRWFFFSTLTGRFTGNPEGMMDSDLNRIKGVVDPAKFIGILNEVMQSTLTGDFWSITLPMGLYSSSARSPELFAFVAAQNRLDAPVLFSHKKVGDLIDPALKTQKKALERHHLYPRGWLEKQGETDLKVINQIANFALLEWPENIAISDDPPSDYVPQLRPRFALSDWDRMHDLHALPAGWEAMAYEDFLDERRRLMAGVIGAGSRAWRSSYLPGAHLAAARLEMVDRALAHHALLGH